MVVEFGVGDGIGVGVGVGEAVGEGVGVGEGELEVPGGVGLVPGGGIFAALESAAFPPHPTAKVEINKARLQANNNFRAFRFFSW